MIKLTDQITSGEGVLFCKLKSESAVYKGIPSALFYETDTGAALGMIDANLTVAGDMDEQELLEFIRFLGAKTITCEVEVARKIGIKYDEVCVLRAEPKGIPKNTEAAAPKEVYEALKNGEDGDIDLPPYDAFLLDYSLRLRRGRAHGIIIKDAVCVVSAVDEKSVIISGVATKMQARSSGFALLAVNAMRQHFAEKECFVLCKKELTGFYEKCGFILSGYIARGRI